MVIRRVSTRSFCSWRPPCLRVAPAYAGSFPDLLPSTAKLELDRPLDVVMVDGINRFALRALDESAEEPPALLATRLHEPRGLYETSIAPNREHLRTILGAVDPRVAASAFELIATTAVRLPARPNQVVYRPSRAVARPSRRHGRRPSASSRRRRPKARVIVLPDADWTPEAFAGLAGGVDRRSQLPRRLAENGVQVVVPTLISRDDTWSGNPAIRFTNQPHREFIYRMAFELGPARHRLRGSKGPRGGRHLSRG